MSDLESSNSQTGDSENTLLNFLKCEALDLNLFRGQSQDFKTGQVFGGQVLGQAIKAAYETIDDERFIHSAHAYFLLRGDVDAPIIYEVDRSLDGRSYSSRRVVAIQHGRQIFHLSASFQKAEKGPEHFESWVPPVDALHSALEAKTTPQHNFQSEYFDTHYLPKDRLTDPNAVQFWLKAKDSLPDSIQCHHSVLAYISDMGLLQAVLQPHDLDDVELEKRQENVMIASLDHAIWFHRPFRADDWLFYDTRPQSIGSGRGLAFGRIFTKDGTLVATTTQEGVLRVRR